MTQEFFEYLGCINMFNIMACLWSIEVSKMAPPPYLPNKKNLFSYKLDYALLQKQVFFTKFYI